MAANFFALLVATSALWLVSLWRRDASIVDPFWGLAFVMVACLSLWLTGQQSIRAIILCALVSVWGSRLAVYLTWRNWGKPEDYRYQAMRLRWGDRFPLVSLATVFLLQGSLAWMISWPVQVGIARAGNWSVAASCGVVLCIVGLLFESIGDYQLARFKANPANRGQVMNGGLWRYTRHPNYFGDFLVWWGFYLVGAESRSWWWTIAGPVLMTVLLVRVSGVRLLESSLKSRVAGYEAYVKQTSPFFPWPPRKGQP